MFVENQDNLKKANQEVERLRRGYDQFDSWVKDKIERMRYKKLEEKGFLGEGFLLMLRYMFQQYKTQGYSDAAGSSGAAQWTSPMRGFYMYLCCLYPLRGTDFITLSNGSCVGLSLIFYPPFPLCEHFYSLVKYIWGIFYLVYIHTYIIQILQAYSWHKRVPLYVLGCDICVFKCLCTMLL